VALLSVNDLSIRLERPEGPVEMVSGLSLDIPEGSVFGLAGESGCGKSLTALAVMGILPKGMHAKGSVMFGGEDLLALPEERLRDVRGNSISMVFQEPMTSLNPVLKVGYQIEEVINTHLAVTRQEAGRMAVSLLRELNIPSPEQRVKEYPHQLSGGMRQRVMMAMAIACSPSILIADEPTTALDVTIEAQLLNLLRSLRDQKDMSVLLITHDLGIIAENAETAAIMYAGRLVEKAPVEELFRRPLHPYTVGLLGSVPEKRGASLKPVRGMVPKPWELPSGCTFSDRCDYAVEACRTEEPMFEEAASGHLSRCIMAREAPWRGEA
jgi:oligopeptide/dipeptide ABC transporter ATP-binding protein